MFLSFFNTIDHLLIQIDIMTEVLNIPITSDARDLFVEHNISTIKTIKATALNEINHKQKVLRQFIGDNYRPLLGAPPVLKEIQNIFDDTQNTLKQLDSFSHTLTSPMMMQTQQPSPYSIISQLYLDSLNHLSQNQFSNALRSALSAMNELKKPIEESYLNISLKFSVDSLPCRIFGALRAFLTSPKLLNSTDNIELNSTSLIDCYKVSDTLLSQFPDLKTRASPTSSAFIDNSLKERIESLVSSATEIPDVCQSFISIIESVILSLPTSKAPVSIVDHLLSTFKSSFEKHVDHFSHFELREILRYSKLIEDSSKSRLSSTQILTVLEEMKLKIDFMSTFLEVFKLLAAKSISLSVLNLHIQEEITKILNDPSIEDFDAGNFVMNSTSSLSLRALGVSPTITDFQKRIDSPILVIVSQLQSQMTKIATIEMLKEPLKIALKDASTILMKAVETTPLSVCLIINALCSLSLAAQLGNSISDLTSIQNQAAKEWAKKIVNESRLILQNGLGIQSEKPSESDLMIDYLSIQLNATGTGFRFLNFLEQSIMKAAGHVQYQPLDSSLRNESKLTVTDFFTDQLKKLEINSARSIEIRKKIEKRAEILFREYSLISQVLSMNGNTELKTLFIQKMSPVEYNQIETKTIKEVNDRLNMSGEMFKLIGGSLQIKDRKPVDFDANVILDRLFPKT